MGEPEYEMSEQVMYRAYDFHQKKIQQGIISEQYTAMTYLGKEWLAHHHELWDLVKNIELLIKESDSLKI